MERLDKAWHTAADTLKNEINALQSAERQWINQNGSEPMAGVQGKGTITDPYDGGNREVQPGAPQGHQNTGRPTDLTSASIDNSRSGKVTMGESYYSYKSSSGTGGGRGQFQSYTRGTPEQRSSHHTASNYSSSGMGNTTHGSGSDMASGLSSGGGGYGASSLSSTDRAGGDYSTQSSGVAQGLGGMNRSGNSQGATASSAGGSGISSGMKDTAVQGSGLQTSQVPSDLDEGYNISGLQEPTPSRVTSKNRQSGHQDTTSSAIRSSGNDKSYRGSSRGSGLQDTTTSTINRGLDSGRHEGSTITDTSRGAGLNKSSQGYTGSNIDSAETGSRGPDKSYQASDILPTTTRDFERSQGYNKHSGLGTTTTSSSKKSSDLDKSYKTSSGSGIMDSTRGSGLQDTSGATQSSGLQGTTSETTRDTDIKKTVQQLYKDSNIGDTTTKYRGIGTGIQDTGSATQSSGLQGATMGSTRDADIKNTAQQLYSDSKDTTTKYRGVDKGLHKGTGVSGSTKDSSMSNTAKSYQRDTGIDDTTTRSSGLDKSYQGSGMTSTGATRDMGGAGGTRYDTTTSKSTGLGSGYQGSDISGTTRESGISHGHRTSGLKDSATKSTGLDSGQDRSGMSSTTRDSGIAQGYDNSGLRDTTSKATRDIDSGYQRSGMGDTSGSGHSQGMSNTRNTGQRSTGTRSSGLDSGSGMAKAAGGSGLANMTKSDLDNHIAVGDIAKKAGLGSSMGAAAAAGAAAMRKGHQQSSGMTSSTGAGSKTQSSGMDSGYSMDSSRGSGMQQGHQQSSGMAPTTSAGSKAQPSGMDSGNSMDSSRGSGMQQGHQQSSGMAPTTGAGSKIQSSGMASTTGTGRNIQGSGIGDTTTSRSTGLDSGHQGSHSGMTDSAREEMRFASQEFRNAGVGEPGQKSNLGDVSTSRSSGYQGAGMTGTTRGSDLGQSHQTPSMGQTSGMRGAEQSSDLQDMTSTRSIDSGYEGAGVAANTRDSGYSQGYGDRSATAEIPTTRTGGINTGYDNAGMAGATRDSGFSQQGYQTSGVGGVGGTGQQSTLREAGSGADVGHQQHTDMKDTLQDHDLAEKYRGSGMDETTKSGADKKFQDASTKDTTSGTQPGRKPSLIERAKKKIGLGDSSDKSSKEKSVGDAAKSGLDQGDGPCQACHCDKPGMDQAYQKSGAGDKLKSGIDERYQGSGSQGATEGADTSREVPPSGFGQTSQSAAGQGYSSSGMQDTSRGAGVEDTSRSGMSQGYAQSGTNDTTQGAGLATTTSSGMNQGYQSTAGAADTTMPSGGQRYQDSGMRDTLESTGVQDTSRSGMGHHGSGAHDTTAAGPSGPGYQTSGTGLQDTSRSGMGHQGSGVQDTTTTGPSGPGYQTSGTGLSQPTRSDMGQTYGGSGMRDVSDEGVGIGETTKLDTDQQYQSGSGMAGAGLTDTMRSTVPEEIEEAEEDADDEEIRVPSTILRSRKRSGMAKRQSGVETDATRSPMSPNFGTSGVDKSIDSTIDQGYSRSGMSQGYQQPGVDAASGNRMDQGYQPSGLGRASESAMDQGYSKSGVDQDAVGSTTAAGTAPRTTAVPGTGMSEGYGQSGLGGTTATSNMDQGYQRSTGMGESTTTDPGMHQLNQDYQQSGIGETTRSGTDQGYQRSGLGQTQTSGTGMSQGQGIQRSAAGAATGSGSTGQDYQTMTTTTKQAPPDFGQQSGAGGSSGGYQTASSTEQRSQGISTGIRGGGSGSSGATAGSSIPMTTTTAPAAGGHPKVSQEALKGPQCPARDPYDFEKAIDNPRRKSLATRTRSNANSSGTAKQAAAASKSEKERLGPLGQMKVKFDKVIHPNDKAIHSNKAGCSCNCHQSQKGALGAAGPVGSGV